VKEIIPLRECPVEKPSRPRSVVAPQEGEAPAGYREAKYRFQYTDIDFNRHVNSSRYIELLLNQWSLDFHDANRLTRFEIAYIHEAHFDMEATLRMQDEPIAMAAEASATRAELIGPDGQPVFRALLRFSPR
jgi:acyl-ACP thioesterase